MKTVFVLGGRGDIGTAICRKFGEQGCQVIAPTSQELDLADVNSVTRYFDDKDIRADVLVNSAGWNVPKPIDEIGIEDIKRSQSINVLGFYQVLKYFLPAFKERREGYVVAVSSLYGTFARSKRLPYVMSKHALNGLIKTLAIELGPYNIKVNAVSPGFVDTKMTRKNNDARTIKSFEERIPLGRLAAPSAIANIVYFLCSSENDYITGQDIIIDGGYSIGGFQA